MAREHFTDDPRATAQRARRPREPERRLEQELASLLAAPRGDRVRRVSKARSRYRGRRLAERLLAESRRTVADEPGEAHDLAATAKAVLYASDLDHEDAPLLWIQTLVCLGDSLKRERRSPDKVAGYLAGARLLLAFQTRESPHLWRELERWRRALARTASNTLAGEPPSPHDG